MALLAQRDGWDVRWCPAAFGDMEPRRRDATIRLGAFLCGSSCGVPLLRFHFRCPHPWLYQVFAWSASHVVVIMEHMSCILRFAHTHICFSLLTTALLPIIKTRPRVSPVLLALLVLRSLLVSPDPWSSRCLPSAPSTSPDSGPILVTVTESE